MEYWLLDIWHWLRQQKRLQPLIAYILAIRPERRIRVFSYATTGLLHLVLFAFISQYNIYLAPVYRIAAGDGGLVSVSVYTLSGSEAVTDAPLNEPTLAESDAEDGIQGDEAQSGDATEGEASDANSDAAEDSADTPVDAGEDVPVPDEPETAEPEEVLPETPEPDSETAPEDTPVVSEDLPVLTAPGSDNEPVRPTETPRQQNDDFIPAPVIQRVRDADLPIATTQVLPRSRVDRLDRPTFAEIEARTDRRLNPTDFDVRASSIGLLQTVLDSFCLSSSEALLEVAECPEGPNPNQILLAEYALMEFGEVPPVFMEDMDRLAFELEQLGADPSMIERLLVSYREALRTARSRDPVLRAMERDATDQTDHLGVNNPFDPDREGPGGG